jgi:hypothetical protein
MGARLSALDRKRLLAVRLIEPRPQLTILSIAVRLSHLALPPRYRKILAATVGLGASPACKAPGFSIDGSIPLRPVRKTARRGRSP